MPWFHALRGMEPNLTFTKTQLNIMQNDVNKETKTVKNF